MRQFAKCFIFCGLLAAIGAQQLGGSVASSLTGGQDVNLKLGHSIGDPKTGSLGGGLFASGNTMQGPVTTGAFLNADKNGHGIGLQHMNQPGFGTTFQQNAHANLFNDGKNNLNANAFHSRTDHVSGVKFDRIGSGLQWDHARGHSASVGISRIPQFDINTVSANAKANIWQSQDSHSRFDLTGGVSKNLGGGPLQKNIGAGFTHFFG